ncbi:MAG: hypothetical protein ACI8RD_008054 [Bacillariaceae sp.]|jgi:hypothetical protein
MSINNGAGVVGTEIGALLTKALGVTESNFDNLWLLSLICNLTSLYPLLFIGWLDEVGTVSEQEIEDQQQEAFALAVAAVAAESSEALSGTNTVIDTEAI